MSDKALAKSRVARLLAGCSPFAMFTVAFALAGSTSGAMAGTFNVGGGTITTGQVDTASDQTGSGGGFALQPNTTGNNDTVAISGVTINNTSGAPSGRAIDMGYTLPSSGSYSVTMSGSSLTGMAASGEAALIENTSGGNLSFDSTGGAANTISGVIGVNLNANGGNVSINTGADTITTSGATGEILYATTSGSGTVTINTAGATLTSAGTYGISVEGGNGAITVGSLNGGMASSLTVTNGTGIYVTSINAPISIAIASAGSITAQNGIRLQGGAGTIDNSGSIAATNNAIDGSLLNSLSATLESGSTTSGAVLGSAGNDSFIVYGGANISGATFNGNGGTDSLTLTGSGNGSLAVTAVSNIQSFQKSGSGTWTLTGTTSNLTPWTISGGTLSISDDAALGSSSGALTLNGGTLQVTATTSGSRAISLGSGGGTLAIGTGLTLTENGVISGAGGLTQNGGTLVLNGAETYSGGTVVNNGTLQLGAGGSLPVNGALTIENGGTFQLGASQSATIGTLTGNIGNVSLNGGSVLTINQSSSAGFFGAINGSGTLIFNGPGALSLSGSSALSGAIIVNGGTFTSSGTLGGGNDITINGGTFETVFRTYGLGALSGTGGTLNLDGSYLTFASAANTTFAGTITDSASGQFTKDGTGTLILTGSDGPTNVVITGGTLQFGNGGAGGGFVNTPIVDNAALVFDRSDNATFGDVISGTGTISQIGTGTVTLTRNVTNTGGITVSSGAIEFQGSTVSTNIVDNSSIIFASSPTAYTGVISGTGSVAIGDGSTGGTVTFNGIQTYTGGTTINGATLRLGAGSSLAPTGAVTLSSGTFDLNNQSVTVGALSGSGSILLGSGTLTVNSSANTVLGAAISQTGSLVKAGTGTLTLTGTNSYTGSTIINGGALQVGNGGTSGVIPGNVTDNAALIFDRSDAVTMGGVISGTGSVQQAGAGILTLGAANSYSGGTSVTAGTLNVTGSVGAVTVANGGTLSGTGKVGAVSVASGGSLNAGAGASLGTLTVQGNLSLASGSSTIANINPSSASLVTVSGTATVSGTLTANASSGTYVAGQRYTLLTASGGVSGTFASLTTPGLPSYVKGRLSYDSNDVFLNLDPNALSPLLPTGATPQQQGVAAGIDAAIRGGATLSPAFQQLFNLSGSNLTAALDQVSGRIGPAVSQASNQSFGTFLNLLIGRNMDADTTMTAYAPDGSYGSAAAPKPAQLARGEMRVWGQVYGGHTGLSADATGAASISASTVGFAGGVETQLLPGLVIGASAGAGTQNFTAGGGAGHSDDAMIAIYGRQEIGDRAYLAAAYGHGWHTINTSRAVTVSGTDVLAGKFDADDNGGRVEGGVRFALGDALGLTPYAAINIESFQAPGYTETAASGASTFALSYQGYTTDTAQGEFGARLARDFAMSGGLLHAQLVSAWAHEFDGAPLVQASFAALPGSAFSVYGVRPSTDAALLGMDLEMQTRSGLSYGVQVRGLVGPGTSILTGSGNLSYRW